MAKTRSFIPGWKFIDRLAELGVIDDPASVSRVVIDANYRGDALMIYVERVGDERILQISHPDVMGTTIKVIDPAKETT